jgi:ribose-phosphate pyrophosphokinase
MNFKITRNGQYLDYKTFNFPGGEISVKLNVKNSVAYVAKTGFFAPAKFQTIIARIQNSNNILELINIVDALSRIDNTPINLFLPYCPFGRQDRVCDAGESFSLKVFANLINSLNLNKVTIVDPHSHVTEALINNVEIITQLQVIQKWLEFTNRAIQCDLISPDLGAEKKIEAIAKYFNHDSYINSTKLRNLATGEILKTEVYKDDFNGRDIVCCDDIIDGGRTFIELAKVCKAKKCGKFILYVTHGIFSKGIDVLFNNHIDEIWTTNSYREDLTATDKFNILDIEKFIENF